MGDGYGGKWAAGEAIRRWEPSLPRGTDLGFLKSLEAQTPRAWVTPLIVGLNVVVSIVMAFAGVDPWTPATDDLIRWGANYGPLTTAGQPWRLLSSAFLHFGALHLALNMAVLWQIGFLTERLVGNWSFLAAYLVATLSGAVASLAWNPYVASEGASAAIFGVFGVLLVCLHRNRGAIPPKVIARFWKGGLLFVLVNLALGMIVPAIDLAGHLGGLVAGLVAGLILNRPYGVSTSAGAVRYVLPLLAGGVALTGGFFALIPRTADLHAEMVAFHAMRTRTDALYESARWQRQMHQLSDADFLKIMDEQVLPPWRDHLDRLRGFRRVRGRIKEGIALTERYIELKERSLAKAAEAVRASDPSKAAESRALDEQAAALVRSLGDSKNLEERDP